MAIRAILIAVYSAGCVWLSVRRLARGGHGPTTPRGRVREIRWGLALMALALSTLGLPVTGGPYVAIALAGVVLARWPRRAETAATLAIALIALGVYGFWLLRSYERGNLAAVQYGLVPVNRGSAGIDLILAQAYAFLAAGWWLLWRTGAARYPWLMAVRTSPQPWRWLLLPVVAMAMELLGPNYWLAPSTWNIAWNVALAGAALLLALRAPATAADLAAAGLAALGVYGMLAAGAWPGYVALTPAFAPVRLGVVLVDSRTLATMAGIEGAVLLGFGLWLMPRTIGAHLRVMLRPEPDARLAGRVEQLTQTRAEAVDSAAAELRRVERDLHDGAQARLVALGMNLRAAERLILASPQAAIALVAEARASSSLALAELRDLVRGIYPPVLADRGLADAVRALALDTPIRSETDIDLPGRLESPVESACFFAVAESLANAVKHSGARLVTVGIRHRDGLLRMEVTDDGAGGADPARGTGLAGIERRLSTFDGIMAVSSPPGGPTMIIMEVPCALSSPRTSSC